MMTVLCIKTDLETNLYPPGMKEEKKGRKKGRQGKESQGGAGRTKRQK